MATLADDDGQGRVSIGAILSRGFRVVAAAPAATLGIAFVFGALPGAALGYALAATRDDAPAALGSAGTVVAGILYLLLVIASSMVTQGALVRATVAHGEGRRATFADGAATGLRMILPLLLLGMLIGGGVLLGFALLMVPGVMLYVMWAVAAPALVAEERGVIEALGRSRDLTRGHRWRVFALLLVTLLAYWLLSAAVGVVGILIYGVRGAVLRASEGGFGGVGLVLQLVGLLVQTVTAALWGTIQTSLYVELRTAKEGPATEALAEIFR